MVATHAMVHGFSPVSYTHLSLEYAGTIIPVELEVYDTDGQPGIFIPNSMEMNAVREVAANMGGSLGSSFHISTNAGAQLASDLGKGLIQGTSQYIEMRIRDRDRAFHKNNGTPDR